MDKTGIINLMLEGVMSDMSDETLEAVKTRLEQFNALNIDYNSNADILAFSLFATQVSQMLSVERFPFNDPEGKDANKWVN